VRVCMCAFSWCLLGVSGFSLESKFIAADNSSVDKIYSVTTAIFLERFN